MTVRIPPATPGWPSKVFTIDFREVAPALYKATMFQDSPSLSKYGGLSVAVPGEVLGLEEAHHRWGTLVEKADPTIHRASRGMGS